MVIKFFLTVSVTFFQRIFRYRDNVVRLITAQVIMLEYTLVTYKIFSFQASRSGCNI